MTVASSLAVLKVCFQLFSSGKTKTTPMDLPQEKPVGPCSLRWLIRLSRSMTRSHFGWTPASKSTKKAEEILTKARPVALGARVGHVVYGPGPPGRGPDLEMGVWVGTTLPEEFNVGDMVGCLEEVS